MVCQCQEFKVTVGYTHSLLERQNFLVGQGIRLGDDGDQVDLGVKALHNLNIQRLEGVTSGLDEEHTSVNAVVDNVHPVNLILRIKISVESLLNVVHNRAPRLVVVNEIAETRCVDNSQPKAHACFLDVCADRLNGDSLGNNLEAGRLALPGRVQ